MRPLALPAATQFLNKISDQGDANQQHHLIGTSTPVGFVLICMSLATAGLQKRLIQQMGTQQPSAYDFLLFTNLSMLASALTIASLTDDLYIGRAFLVANPICWTLLLRSCLFSAIGQSFIFYVITVFDPFVLSTVVPLRRREKF